ncbi:MAG: hypothetical protein WCA15_04315, partial [Candidatus Acidiferrales bacterium]
MKTIFIGTLGAFVGLFAAAPAALAIGSTAGASPVFSSPQAQSSATSQSAKQNAAPSDGTHADVYYYFTMGHVDEMQF